MDRGNKGCPLDQGVGCVADPSTSLRMTLGGELGWRLLWVLGADVGLPGRRLRRGLHSARVARSGARDSPGYRAPVRAKANPRPTMLLDTNHAYFNLGGWEVRCAVTKRDHGDPVRFGLARGAAGR